ncbi:MAG: tetratricopeptide repeat protein [Planctomycetota bacterium]|jgi:tetratricopeptide (TPR) repeat protein
MIQRIRTLLAIATTSFCLLGIQSLQAQDRDRVFPVKGPAVTGKIVEKNRDKVVIEVRGNNQNFPSNEILRVLFEGEPTTLSRTKDLVAQGQIEQAVDEFKKIDAASLPSEDMKQDYQFLRGYIAGTLATKGKGDPKNALTLLTNWVKDNAQSYQFYQAAELMGDLAVASGTPDQAAKYYGGLAAAPFPELKTKGSFLQGKALMASKQNADAKAKYQAVLEAKLSDPVSLKFQKMARIGIIQCDALEGKATEAIGELEKMVDEGDSTDGELFAELFNTLGSLFAAAGRNEEAVLSYLKTDQLYGAQSEPHAESLYRLNQLWTKMGSTQKAADAKQKLEKLYPTSPWVRK